jgi:Spy/CpxP family protein refolding chaperone
VVATIKKYRAERVPVQQEMRKHREAVRTLLENKSSDETAYATAIDGMDAQKKKLAEIQQRQVSEIRGILKASEQAKVMKLMHDAKQRRGHAGHSGKGAKQKNAKNASHGEDTDVS